MNFRFWLLVVCVSFASACGDPVVGFPSDGATDAIQLFDAAADAGIVLDAAVLDAAVLDAAVLDAAVLDAAVLDAAVLDAAVLDAAVLDAAVPDAAVPDAAVPDAAALDAAVPPVPPEVIATLPVDGALDVPVDTSVEATFDVAMDAATLTAASFTLTGPAGEVIEGVLSYDALGFVASFAPVEALQYGTEYTATLTEAVTDVAGTPLAAAYSWSFTTAQPPVPPEVVATLPVDGALDVPVDTSVEATFDVAMDAATLTAASFTLTGPAGEVIEGVLAYDALGFVASFAPIEALQYGTEYTATLTEAVTNVAGTPLAAAYSWIFITAQPPVPPEVVATAPVNGAVDVPVDTSVEATFDVAMDAATLTAASFTLTGPAGLVIEGVLSYDALGFVASFAPVEALQYGAEYTATLTEAVTNVAGTPLAAAYSWTFTTAQPPVPPEVVATAPVDGAVDVPVDTSVEATFDVAMDAATLTAASFTLTGPAGEVVEGVLSYDAIGFVASFAPVEALQYGTEYTATLTEAVTDVAGTPLAAAYSWSFTTAQPPVPPEVVATLPVDGALDVPVDTSVEATFDVAMDAATLTAASFTLTGPAGEVIEGVLAYDALGFVASFAPIEALQYGTEYTATLTEAVTNVAGTPLAAAYSWIFITAQPPVPPEVVATAPVNGALDVPVDTSVEATFDVAMDAATLTAASFTLTGPAGEVIEGVLSYDALGFVASFAPIEPLQYGTEYTATLTEAVTNVAGTPLAAAYTWIFTTAQPPVPPEVVATLPADGALDVPVDTSVDATFDVAMDAATLTAASFTLTGPAGEVVEGVLSYDALSFVASFAPVEALQYGTEYTATLTEAVTNVAGTPLAAAYTWTFTTAQPPVPPEVVATLPVDGALDVPVDTSVEATFDVAMDAATLTAASFTLTGPAGEAIEGVLSYDALGFVASFAPIEALQYGTEYTATLTEAVTDVAGTPLAAAYSWTFTTAQPPVPPEVVATAPVNGALDVPVDTSVEATFDVAMDAATLTAASFTLTGPAGLVIEGVLSYDALGFVVSFAPIEALQYGTEYTATLTEAVTNVAGTPLVAAYSWTFTTAQPPVPPEVVATLPVDGALDVPVDTSVEATFDVAMDAATLTAASFTLTGPAGLVIEGVLSYDALGFVASFAPVEALQYGTEYTATLTQAVTNLAGTPLAAAYTWTFTTAQPPVSPEVVATLPVNGALDVPVDTSVEATFDVAMDAATLTAASFTLTGPAGEVIEGALAYDALSFVASFTPVAVLQYGTEYTATLTEAVTNVAGTPLAATYTWSFTTAQPPVPPEVIATLPADGALDVLVGTSVEATFDVAMDAATLTAVSFTLTGPAGLVIEGVLAYDALSFVASFTPVAVLQYGTEYTATLTEAVTNVAGTPLAATYTWSFTTAQPPVPPEVIATLPVDGALDVPVDTSVEATFDLAMDAATLTAASFTLTGPAGEVIEGVLSYDALGFVASFTPIEALQYGTEYSATLTEAVTNVAGTPLAAAYSWTFTTAQPPVPPEVIATAPVNGAVDVPVDTSVEATFDVAMDAATLTAASFAITGPAGLVIEGVLGYDALGFVATFTPIEALQYGTEYTATLTEAVSSMAGTPLAAAYTWTFTTAQPPVPPEVVATAPVNGALDVAVDTSVEATFDVAMDAATLTAASFTVTGPGGLVIEGVLSYDALGFVASFTPVEALQYGTEYTATLTQAVTNVAGTPLAAAYAWTFTTAQPPVPPEVVATLPVDGALDVPVGTSVEATFDVAMDAATLTPASFTLTGPAGLVIEGVLSYDALGFMVSFAPVEALQYGTEYTATLTEAVTNVAGTPLAAAYSWIFITAQPPVPPEVVATAPVNGALDVPVDTSVEATFDVAMDAATLTAASFTLTGPAGEVIEGVLSYDAIGFVASFTPIEALQYGTEYTATLTEAVTNVAGTPLAAAYTWTFTTVAEPVFLLEPVNLRSLNTFAVAAGAGLTNSDSGGFTVINGDVALSPTATCVSNGVACNEFSPIINGTLYANDPEGVAEQAVMDLSAAYADAMSRPAGTIVSDLSGLVLAPGVYTSASTMSIAVGGTVTLDGQGDPNAVFIFQIGSSITVNGNAQVVLVNGARAQYVYWAVAASSTLGEDVDFQGSVLAGASNTVGTGSTVLGRLLCRSGQVTLLANTITRPPL